MDSAAAPFARFPLLFSHNTVYLDHYGYWYTRDVSGVSSISNRIFAHLFSDPPRVAFSSAAYREPGCDFPQYTLHPR